MGLRAMPGALKRTQRRKEDKGSTSKTPLRRDHELSCTVLFFEVS